MKLSTHLYPLATSVHSAEEGKIHLARGDEGMENYHPVGNLNSGGRGKLAKKAEH